VSPKQIMQKYRKRIMAIMNKIAEAVREAGFRIDGPDFLDGENYSWSILSSFRDRPQPDGSSWDEDVNIDVNIIESEPYGEPKGGVNFGLDIVEVGGGILGGVTPYNYTDEVWVPRRDKEAVEERFKIFEESIDPSDVVRILEEHKEESIKAMPRIPPGVKEWRP